MRVKPIEEIFQKTIDDRRRKLKAEIEDLRQRQHDDEAWYGLGGAYQRKEEAIERRERQLDELDGIEAQLNGLVKLHPMSHYKIFCRDCGNIFTSQQPPIGEYHECPRCKKMVYDNAPKKYTYEATEETMERRW